MITLQQLQKEWQAHTGTKDLSKDLTRNEDILYFLAHLEQEGLIITYFEGIQKDCDYYITASTAFASKAGYISAIFEWNVSFLYKYNVADLEELHSKLEEYETKAQNIINTLK